CIRGRRKRGLEYTRTASRTEPVVQADAYYIVSAIAALECGPSAYDAGYTHCGIEAIDADVKIFELCRPFAPQCSLNTNACAPSECGARQARKISGYSSNSHSQIVLSIYKRSARGHVRHEPVKSQTNTTPSRHD